MRSVRESTRHAYLSRELLLHEHVRGVIESIISVAALRVTEHYRFYISLADERTARSVPGSHVTYCSSTAIGGQPPFVVHGMCQKHHAIASTLSRFAFDT